AADPAFEALFRAFVVVLHQLGHIVSGDRPAIRVFRERREDGPRTRGLLLLTNEDALAARRRTQALRVERSLKLEGVHAIQAILAAAGRDNLQLVVGLG